MGTGYLKKILYAGLGTAFYRDERPGPVGDTDLAAITMLQLLGEHSLYPATPWETEEGAPEDDRETVTAPLSQETSAVVKESEAGAGESGQGKITGEAKCPRESWPEVDRVVDGHPGDRPAGTIGAVSDTRDAAAPGVVPAGMKGQEAEGTVPVGGAMSAAAVPFVNPLHHDDTEGVPVIEVVRRDALPVTDKRKPAGHVAPPAGTDSQFREGNDTGTTGEHGIPESRNWERLKENGARPLKDTDGEVESFGEVRACRPEAGITGIQSGTSGVSAHGDETGITGRSGIAAPFAELITRPEEHVNTLTYLFSTSPGKDDARISRITRDIALLGEKLDNHIRGGERMEAPVFVRKRPASNDLGGWSDTERRYIR